MATRSSPRLREKRENGGTTPAAPGLKLSKDVTEDEALGGLPPSSTGKLYIRGTISNSLGFGLLYLCGTQLGLMPFVLLAAGIQLAVFLFHGLPQSSEKYYDLSGSFTHFSLVAFSLCIDPRVRNPRQILCALLSVVWMTRLGTFLFGRIVKDGKDERFDHLKRVWLAFMGAWNLQACWVTLVQLPVILINNIDDKAPIGPVDYMALFLWVVGFLFEFQADIEKSTFRSDPKNKSKFITTGVWSLSRHPNYFGEILMWCAMALSVSHAGYQLNNSVLFWAWGSPAFTTLLLLKVSGVPMVEKAGLKKWGDNADYMHYVNNTSCVIPWFPAKKA